ERQDVVGLRLPEPEVYELGDLLGMLLGEVARLLGVLVGVEELPAVVLEVADPGERAVLGDRLPALVPDAARAEHLVVLRLLVRRRARVVERVAHRDAG